MNQQKIQLSTEFIQGRRNAKKVLDLFKEYDSMYSRYSQIVQRRNAALKGVDKEFSQEIIEPFEAIEGTSINHMRELCIIIDDFIRDLDSEVIGSEILATIGGKIPAYCEALDKFIDSNVCLTEGQWIDDKLYYALNITTNKMFKESGMLYTMASKYLCRVESNAKIGLEALEIDHENITMSKLLAYTQLSHLTSRDQIDLTDIQPKYRIIVRFGKTLDKDYIGEPQWISTYCDSHYLRTVR